MKNKRLNTIYSIFGLEENSFIPCKTRQEARDLSKHNKNNKILDLGNRGTLTLKGIVKNTKPKTGNRYYIVY